MRATSIKLLEAEVSLALVALPRGFDTKALHSTRSKPASVWGMYLLYFVCPANRFYRLCHRLVLVFLCLSLIS